MCMNYYNIFLIQQVSKGLHNVNSLQLYHNCNNYVILCIIHYVVCFCIIVNTVLTHHTTHYAQNHECFIIIVQLQYDCIALNFHTVIVGLCIGVGTGDCRTTVCPNFHRGLPLQSLEGHDIQQDLDYLNLHYLKPWLSECYFEF